VGDNPLSFITVPIAAAIVVFLLVAVTMAAVLYRLLYSKGGSGGDRSAPGAMEAASPPSSFCPQCGVQNSGSGICNCGFNLASVQFSQPALPVQSEQRPVRNAWGIYDELSARAVAKQGMWAAFFVAIVTAAVSFLAGAGVSLIKGIGPTAWLDAAIFAALGFGIRNMSRAAAVGALVLYVAERVVMAQTSGLNPAMAIGVVLGFVQGIRGTFAFQKYRQQVGYSATSGSLAPQ